MVKKVILLPIGAKSILNNNRVIGNIPIEINNIYEVEERNCSM